MQRRFIILAAVFGFLGVALGAFGAHGLQATLEANDHVDTFRTAVEYQMVHALVLIGAAWVSTRYPGKLIQWAGYLFAAGIILFSGSLYVLSLFDAGFMGAIAPLGGTALLAGWACLGFAAWRAEGV
jgi:uncharacterized membrane protein YgdD (TMEM256/DUF423 family)